VFVLDMGRPVRILELAQNMIRLSGKEPERDIEIVYSGIRPGAKLHEELWGDHETVSPTEHPKIRKLTCPAIDPKWLDDELAALAKLVAARDAEGVAKRLAKIAGNAQRIQSVETTKTAPVADAIDALSEQPAS
jgi:FlaA1/EpsC-like NDP-sugar epimerase